MTQKFVLEDATKICAQGGHKNLCSRMTQKFVLRVDTKICARGQHQNVCSRDRECSSKLGVSLTWREALLLRSCDAPNIGLLGISAVFNVATALRRCQAHCHCRCHLSHPHPQHPQWGHVGWMLAHRDTPSRRRIVSSHATRPAVPQSRS